MPAAIPPTANGTTSGVSVSGPKVATIDCSGRTQRKAPGSAEAAPQRMDFGQGKLLMISGRSLGQHVERLAAGPLDHREVELALLGIGDGRGLIQARQPRALQEALDGRLGGADPRAAALLAHGLAPGGQAGDVQRQPARRRERLGALVQEAARHQGVGDELLEILRRAPLHAGGDLFRAEFEQEVGHGAAISPRRTPVEGRATGLSRASPLRMVESCHLRSPIAWASDTFQPPSSRTRS